MKSTIWTNSGWMLTLFGHDLTDFGNRTIVILRFFLS
jgi:hypothetical protein